MDLKLKKNYIPLIIIFLTVISCEHKNETTRNKELHCIIPNSKLIGKEYLDENYLSKINKIKTSKKHSNSLEGMVLIKGGDFDMGGDFPEVYSNLPKSALPQNDEFPKHRVRVSSFYMDENEVTIEDFKEFIDATNYKTVAELDIDWYELKKQLPDGTPKPNDELLKAGASVFHYINENISNDNISNWWTFTVGACWKKPNGKTYDLELNKNMPVTQVSWYDAMAYAKWVGKRLPTEAEYEYAMRGKLNNNIYPWGNDTLNMKKNQGNFLQGEFPYSNTGEDGYISIAPVKSYKPNKYGLYDIAGNVWEWTLDWYSPIYYKQLKDQKTITINPLGPDKTFEIYNSDALSKVLRGGSYLCNDNWCSGYRNSRRMRVSPDSGMEHIGFRLVKDL